MFAIETLAAPGDDFTPEQWEAHAQNIALLATFNGRMLDGVPVEFTIDREHIMGHRELDGQEGTECPGDAQIAGLDALIERALEIYEEGGNPPPSGCLPNDQRAVPVADLIAWRDAAPWPVGENINDVIDSGGSGRSTRR
jgi:hypothetical protein